MTDLGIITSVVPKPAEKMVYVNVVTGPNREPREVPFVSPKVGWWVVPKAGQAVEVVKVDGQWAARFPQSRPTFSMPSDLSEGDLSIKFNEDTEVRVRKNGDDTYSIEVSADGDISVDATGDVTVNGESITLGNEGGAESLAVQSHTHPYSWSDSGGSGNTGTPNETGTDTQIE